MRMVGKMGNNSGERVSPYLLLEPPILRDACRALRRDDDGRRCASCCVREFCQRQASRAALFAVAD
jgi:hypothetical protein